MIKRSVKLILATLGIVFVTTTSFILFFGFRCIETPIREIKSPNGALRAVVFEANCHSTEPVVTHVNLGRSDRNFKRTMINNTVDEGEVFAVVGGGYDLTIKWQDDSTLMILCPHCKPKNVMEQKAQWDRVSIRFE